MHLVNKKSVKTLPTTVKPGCGLRWLYGAWRHL